MKTATVQRREEWIFTFGWGQPHFPGFVAIEAEGAEAARAEMMRRFGAKWSMQYASREEAGVERFGLKEVR